MIFFIYQLLTSILLIFSPFIILYRIFKNKEDKFRVKEKFCFSSKLRGNGKHEELLVKSKIYKNFHDKQIQR